MLLVNWLKTIGVQWTVLWNRMRLLRSRNARRSSRNFAAGVELLEVRWVLAAPNPFELSSLLAVNGGDGTAGLVINGVAFEDRAGNSVSNAGDVNGDGFDDLLIGDDWADPNGRNSGASYVVFGKSSGFTASLNLSALDGTNGFRVEGTVANEASGSSVSGAGDVNGDGFHDLLIGNRNLGPNGTGAAYVVFGKSSGFTASLNLSALDGTNGFVLNGVAPLDRTGFSVSGAGDVNGDGFDDILIGAPFVVRGNILHGASYLVFGKSSGFAASLSLSALDGTNGFVLIGSTTERSGYSVSGAGDVNGDGFDDLVIGADIASPNGRFSGASYVVFGKSSGFAASLNLTTLDGSNGFRLNGVAAYDYSGHSVSGAGDVNGDGFDDLLIGAPSDPFGYGNGFGAAYVVFGKSDGFAANINLSTLDGTNGFVLKGVAKADRAGFSASGAGDFNGDGFDDLVIGAPYADPNGSLSGASYLVFGKSSGFAASLNLSSLDGTSGFVLNGVEGHILNVTNGDLSGRSVSGAGDMNGDGFDDLVIGAPFRSNSGASFVVFGHNFGITNQLPSVSVNGGLVEVNESQTAHNSGLWADADANDVVTLSATIGTVTKNANGTWSWSFDTVDGPDQSQTVTITADDGHDGVTDTSFSLIVNNLDPTANDDAVSIGEDDPATVIHVLANDTDPAGANDPLSVSAINTSGTQGAVTLDSGEIRYSADSFFEALGAGEVDIDLFEYTISDGDGGSSTATVTLTITGQNDAPTANGTLADLTVNQNAASTVINLVGKFSDVDTNDSLTITSVSSSIGLVAASLMGNSLTLDYQAHQSGSAIITVTATDESGATVSLSFQVTVKSDDILASGLIAAIQQLVTQGKITSSKASEWSKKLDSALASYDDGRGNITPAVNKLNALKNDVAAQTKGSKPKLTSAEANVLFGLIEELADAMTE